MKKIYFAFCTLLMFSCTDVIQNTTDVDSSTPEKAEEVNFIPEPEKEEYTLETIQNGENNWGYKILLNGNLYINQPHIPAIAGVKGFSTQKNAEITANYAIFKLNNGIIPPTITKQELDSLNVLN